MPKTDAYEAEILAAYDKGELKSVATPDELTEFSAQKHPAERDLYRKAAARLVDKSSAVKVELDEL